MFMNIFLLDLKCQI